MVLSFQKGQKRQATEQFVIFLQNAQKRMWANAMFSLGFWQVGRFVTHHFSTFAYVYDVLSRPEDEGASFDGNDQKPG